MEDIFMEPVFWTEASLDEVPVAQPVPLTPIKTALTSVYGNDTVLRLSLPYPKKRVMLFVKHGELENAEKYLCQVFRYAFIMRHYAANTIGMPFSVNMQSLLSMDAYQVNALFLGYYMVIPAQWSHIKNMFIPMGKDIFFLEQQFDLFAMILDSVLCCAPFLQYYRGTQHFPGIETVSLPDNSLGTFVEDLSCL
jgi:hypothetical protein